MKRISLGSFRRLRNAGEKETRQVSSVRSTFLEFLAD